MTSMELRFWRKYRSKNGSTPWKFTLSQGRRFSPSYHSTAILNALANNDLNNFLIKVSKIFFILILYVLHARLPCRNRDVQKRWARLLVPLHESHANTQCGVLASNTNASHSSFNNIRRSQVTASGSSTVNIIGNHPHQTMIPCTPKTPIAVAAVIGFIAGILLLGSRTNRSVSVTINLNITINRSPMSIALAGLGAWTFIQVFGWVQIHNNSHEFHGYSFVSRHYLWRRHGVWCFIVRIVQYIKGSGRRLVVLHWYKEHSA